MNPQTTAWLLFAVIGAASGLILEGLIRLANLLLTKTKPLALLLDEEGGVDFHGRVRLDAGHIIIGKGDKQKRYPVKAESRRLTTDGPLYLLTRQTGTNLVVPSRDDIRTTLEANERVVFETCDPALLGNVFARRMAQETLQSQLEKDDWKKSAIVPVSIVACLAIIGLIVSVLKFGH